MRLAAPTFVLAMTLCAAVSLTARQDSPAPVFKSESDLVVLHVNVFDGRSDAVPNLPQSAFRITEDDAPQTITFFSNEDVPVAVGLVVDNSGSMIARRRMVLTGSKVFAESSHPEDEVFTIVFNEHVRFGLPEPVAFTQSALQLQASLNRFPAGGMTALHDAVVAGLEHLQEAAHQKRVLIVLSDGEDNASRHTEEDMLARAVRSDTIIYTVSTADLDTNVGKPRLLKKLAELSGGAAFTPKSETDVVEAFRAVADNIRRGYSLGYVPTNPAHDGRFRRVKVTVRAQGHRNLNVSARDGYLAPRHDDAH